MTIAPPRAHALQGSDNSRPVWQALAKAGAAVVAVVALKENIRIAGKRDIDRQPGLTRCSAWA